MLVLLLLLYFILPCAITSSFAQQPLPYPYLDKAWDEWKLRTEDGCNLYIRESTHKGPTILVIHGGFGAEQSYLYQPLMQLYSSHHLVFYDQRGSMRSLCADSLISVSQHVQDIERIRKALGVDSLVIIGHSMGTYLAMRYATEYPQHVRGLVLIGSVAARSTVAQLTSELGPSALKRWERPEVLDTLKANGLALERSPDYTSKQRGTWHRITFAAINLHSVKNWRDVTGSFFFQEKANQLSALSMDTVWDFTEQLRAFGKPVTIIHGEDDYIPIAWNREWIKEVPNATLLAINNAGHLPWIDQPEEFSSKLRQAVDRILWIKMPRKK